MHFGQKYCFFSFSTYNHFRTASPKTEYTKYNILLLDNDSKCASEVARQISEGAIAETVNFVFRPVQTPVILNTCGVFA